jgi:hypothetical protein
VLLEPSIIALPNDYFDIVTDDSEAMKMRGASQEQHASSLRFNLDGLGLIYIPPTSSSLHKPGQGECASLADVIPAPPEHRSP